MCKYLFDPLYHIVFALFGKDKEKDLSEVVD